MKRRNLAIVVIMAICLMVTNIFFFPAEAQAKALTSISQVKKLAKKEVKGGKIIKVEQDYENGQIIYDVELSKGKKEYNLDYRARDSKLISYEWEIKSWYVEKGRGKYISENKAKKQAKKQAKKADIVSIEQKRSSGIDIYKVKMEDSSRKYEVKIHARTGKVLEFEWNLITKTKNNKKYIGEKKAKQIALARVGSGKVVKVELEKDDGQPVYEVEIISGEFEYDIEIHARTGKIIKFEMESIYD